MTQQTRLTKKQRRMLRQQGEDPVSILNSDKFKIKEIQPKTDNQSKVFDYFDDGKHLLLHGTAGTGKAQPLDCKVLTPAGFVEMGDLKVGDSVIAIDGSSVPIMGIYPQGITPVLELTFNDGTSTRCNPEHLWTGWLKKHKWKKADFVTIDTTELKKLMSVGHTFSVPYFTPNEGETINLPIDPYLLGVLIGDGCLGSSATIFTTSDKEILASVTEVLARDYPELEIIQRAKYDFRISSVRGKTNRLSRDIRNLSLNKKSYTKFIPAVYFNGSRSQRLALLQGLMDTDGTVDPNTGCPSFSSVSQQLAYDVQQLILSLGGKSSVSCMKTRLGCGVRFDVSCSLPNKKEVFTLERKKKKVNRNFDTQQHRRKLKNIVEIEPEHTQCISINHPSNLYITDNYIVTHNTFLSVYLALEAVLSSSIAQKKVVIVRSVVPTRDMGFLPGNAKEKSKVYEAPYYAICNELFGRGDAYDILKSKNTVDFITTSFIRGTTFNNAFIVVDEINNMSGHELDSIITRVGKDCRIIFCGDMKQSDLSKEQERAGLKDFIRILNAMPGFAHVEFTSDDILRSSLVKQYIVARDNLGIHL